MTTYSQEFQEKMVEKLLCPDGPTVIQLTKESGVSKSALYKWLKNFNQKASNKIEASTVKMTVNSDKPSNKNVPIRPQNWSAVDKLNAINVTLSMTDEEIGLYCRENGIYSRHLMEWRQSIIEGLKPSVNKEQKIENIKLKTELKSLKSELNRKDRALAETTALLVLKKKANLIWGDEKDD